MTKRMLIMLVVAAVVFGGIFGFQAFKSQMIKKYMSARGVPPQTVSTITASEQAWQPQLEAVG
ncbi:MAG TPA: efflux transporter periplasmic adaptor subunit, partial [Nitrospirae bacterium]|nr:efflux transporter periplasmic adaptor subunit [Nitrospirota bacterium]